MLCDFRPTKNKIPPIYITIAKLNDQQITTFLEAQLVNRVSFYQQANYRLTSAQITESELKKLILKHAS